MQSHSVQSNGTTRAPRELLSLFSMHPAAVQEYRAIVRSYVRSFLSRPEVVDPAIAPADGLPADGATLPFSAYLDYLLDQVIPASPNLASPRCMGHMTSVIPGFVWPLSEVVLALNQNLVKTDASRMLTVLEREALAKVHQLVYCREKEFYLEHEQNARSRLGISTTGGTVANISALWIARNRAFPETATFQGIESEGFAEAFRHYGYERAVVLASRFAHYSIAKAAGVLGLGERNVISIPVDSGGRMKVDRLQAEVERCREHRWRVVAIVATAGTTDCGSIDDLPAIAAVARDARIHFHVDAAWGIALLFSSRHRKQVRGIEHADTVTADGHKQLYLPIGSSMLLLRDPAAAAVIEKQSRYMLQERSSDLGKCSLEGSRSGTSMLLHAALHVIGKEGYGFLVEENIRKARHMAELIQRMPEFSLLVAPETNIILYRYIPRRLRAVARRRALTIQENALINDFNEKLQALQRDEGRTFVSSTTIDDVDIECGPVLAFRAVISNPLTTEPDIRYLLEDQLAIAGRLENSEVSDVRPRTAGAAS